MGKQYAFLGNGKLFIQGGVLSHQHGCFDYDLDCKSFTCIDIMLFTQTPLIVKQINSEN